jgi:hypothetical protein
MEPPAASGSPCPSFGFAQRWFVICMPPHDPFVWSLAVDEDYPRSDPNGGWYAN